VLWPKNTLHRETQRQRDREKERKRDEDQSGAVELWNNNASDWTRHIFLPK
jgi:hypothetical protein